MSTVATVETNCLTRSAGSDPLLARGLFWYTALSCAGLVARRMLTFGAVEADA